MRPLRKILIANRGEIALRIQRTCRELGIATVAVHSTVDSEMMHVRLADESVCIGEAPAVESYLNKGALLSAAEITGADAIHPGYGFLSENAVFAEMVEEHKLVFIGPDHKHITLMGDKIQAKSAARSLGLTVVPGSAGVVREVEQAGTIAQEIGYPVLVKAVSGGGGRGMKLVTSAESLPELFFLCQQEAQSAFGSSQLYIEKHLPSPRHIEVQVLGDGNGKAVHFWERDCSLQRRHQKVVEEAPAPTLSQVDRERICAQAARCAAEMGYRGVGTFEFLYQDGEFYFIEMNTRIQVEHPVTEAICGVDLIAEQIHIAEGRSWNYDSGPPPARGVAIEFRINAEHAETFLPSPGFVENYHAPGGLGLRVDSALYHGYRVPSFYDSMIAKLIVTASSRDLCIRRALRALDEYAIEGIETNLALHRRIVQSSAFRKGEYDVRWLEDKFLSRDAA